MPVLEYIAARWRASRRLATHSSARPSFQVMAGAIGVVSPRHTSVGSCPVSPIAATRSRQFGSRVSPALECITAMALTKASIQSEGACSACSGNALSVENDASLSPTSAPSAARATTLTADVPRSIPRMRDESSDMSAQPACDLVGHRQRTLDIAIGVGEGNEQIFEGARMEQHATLEHSLPPEAKELMVCIARGIPVVADWTFREPDLQYRPQADHESGQSMSHEDFGESLVEAGTTLEQRLIAAGLCKLIECRVRRRDRYAIRTIGSRHRYRAIRYQRHDVAPAAESRHREAATEPFRKHREVRLQSEQPLRPSEAQPKPRDHLVVDEDDVMGIRELAHGPQVTRLGQDAARVAHDGLREDRGDGVALASHRLAQRLDIVPRQDDEMLSSCAGQTRTLGYRHGARVGPRFLEGRMLAPVHGVGEAVIHPLEAHHFIATRECARETQAVDDRFGARVAEAYLLDAGHGCDDLVRKLRLLGRRQCEHGAARLDLLDHRGCHADRSMAEDHGTQTEQVVDVGIAIDIKQIRALAALDKQRIRIPSGPRRSRRAIDARRNRLAGLPVKLGAARRSSGVSIGHRHEAILGRGAKNATARVRCRINATTAPSAIEPRP